MSIYQGQITGSLKVQSSLTGLLYATSGVVSAVALGSANGVATLDSNGRLPISQLSTSAMEIKGDWDASLNSPSLANGTGNIGDVYRCSVAGSVNFGAGSVTFIVGDLVYYTGSIWQIVANSFSLTTSGASGSASLTGRTLNIPTYTLTGLGGVASTRSLTINGTAYDLSADRSWNIPSSPQARTVTTQTATLNQQVFTVSYTSGQIDVYYNGSYLAPSDYTATNGTSVTLAFQCKANDVLVFAAYTNTLTIGGSGVSNYMAKWNSSSLLTSSTILYDTGSLLFVNKSTDNSSGAVLQVNGYITQSTLSAILKADSSGKIVAVTSGDFSSFGFLTGTGTTNTLTKYTGTSTIGNSNISDNGSLITLASNSYISGALGVGSTPVGSSANLHVDASMTGATTVYGINMQGTVQSDVTGNAYYYQSNSRTQATTFTLSALHLFYATQGTFGSGSTVTNQYGFTAGASLIGATNNYGYYGNIPSGTGRWNIYMAGTANNYMAGSLGIGSTSLTGYNLRIAKNITGLTSSLGISQDGTIQSDVTNAVRLNHTNISTAAASFNLTTLQHYVASALALGAGSSVTSQFGFSVLSNVIGATNNYGFYGALAAATNTWNIYMLGTANNYMAGSLGIGTATIGANLHIKTALSTASSEEIALRVESTPTGGTADRQIELVVKNDGTAANTYGLIRLGNQNTNTSTPSNVLITASGSSYFNGGGSLNINTYQGPDAGPITSITLTNGGSGYVDGTYTNITFTASGQSLYASATYVVVGGIVTSATLVNGGSNYTVNQTLTTANTNLGGTGSGLVVTVATVDSSLFRIQNAVANSALSSDISLFHYNNTTLADEGLGFIKWETTDASSAAAGIQAKFGVYSASATGGAYFTFATRTSTSNVLTERVRIDQNGAVGIGATALTGYSLRVSKNVTGAVTSFGIVSDGNVQSDVTTQARGVYSNMGTAAASFTLAGLVHFRAEQGTIGAGSTVTSQIGYWAGAMNGSTNTQGFYGDVTAGTNKWNLFMNSTANNYMAGSLGIGSTSLTGYSLRVNKNPTGATVTYGISMEGTIQSDVTSAFVGYRTLMATVNSAFTLGILTHFDAYQGTIGAGSTLTTQYGFVAESNMIGATNNYGFYGNIPAQTNAWNLYMNGTANNYMAGSLGIGSTSLTGITLRVSNNITGATTSYAIRNTGVVQSDVTSAAFGVSNTLQTAAAAFTLGSYYHFAAGQSTIGVGSAVTNQYGYFVDSTLTGATNNYGFYGNIASGTNRWNLYMGGTAANYIAGQVAIGTTTLVATAALNVSSTTQGFLPPVMTTTQKNAISSPATGLVVFDSTLGKLCVYGGAAWQTITSL